MSSADLDRGVGVESEDGGVGCECDGAGLATGCEDVSLGDGLAIVELNGGAIGIGGDGASLPCADEEGGSGAAEGLAVCVYRFPDLSEDVAGVVLEVA